MHRRTVVAVRRATRTVVGAVGRLSVVRKTVTGKEAGPTP